MLMLLFASHTFQANHKLFRKQHSVARCRVDGNYITHFARFIKLLQIKHEAKDKNTHF